MSKAIFIEPFYCCAKKSKQHLTTTPKRQRPSKEQEPSQAETDRKRRLDALQQAGLRQQKAQPNDRQEGA